MFISLSYFLRNNNAIEWNMRIFNIISFEDKILIETCGNLKGFFARRLVEEYLTKMEKTNVGRLSLELIMELNPTTTTFLVATRSK